MPQSVRYVAKRSLISGHSANSTYSMSLYVTEKDRQREVNSDRQETLTGVVHTTYHGGIVLYRLETRPYTLTEARQMREFLDSVEDGSTFHFDPDYWAASSPSNLSPATLEKPGYTERRSVKQGGDQTGDRYTFSFTVRLTP